MRLPISRGKSITKSNWIQDMGRFYGMNIFLAETSATSGGLDSLLDPHGPIKKAQELAARAFGAQKTFFCTNGTSTANKIVVQALVRPGGRLVYASAECKGNQRADAGSGHEQPAHGIISGHPLHRLVQMLELRAQHTPDFQEWCYGQGKVRALFKQILDPALELGASDSPNLHTEIPQQAAQVVLRVNDL